MCIEFFFFYLFRPFSFSFWVGLAQSALRDLENFSNYFFCDGSTVCGVNTNEIQADKKKEINYNEMEKNKTGRDKSRTHDLSHAKGTRYQLRHTPCFVEI